MPFLLPVIFFSIFATAFGGQGDARTARISVAVVDEDHSEFSSRLVAGLRNETGLRVRTTADDKAARPILDRASAEQSVKNGDVPVAVVIPSGLGESFAKNGFSGNAGVSIRLLSDVSDPIAPQVVFGLLQNVTMTAAPDLLMQGSMRQFEQYAGAMTPQQKSAVDAWMPKLRERSQSEVSTAGGAKGGMGGTGVGVEVVDVMRGHTNRGSLISFYAAGVGVMFLLFSSVASAGGSLLEEAEAGTLERLLSTNMSLTTLIAGKWIYIMLGGIAQLTVMFIWGDIAFGLPLFSHLPGFFVMTIVTAGAAAGLGLLLATLARSREQLSGFSTILVLTMSALGGSMFPRFLMSETMQKVGLLTFNAWALDGYLKVFWRDAALWQLWPQVLVLSGLTAAFLVIARLPARRWEAA